jgi:hypothetical protein
MQNSEIGSSDGQTSFQHRRKEVQVVTAKDVKRASKSTETSKPHRFICKLGNSPTKTGDRGPLLSIKNSMN